MAKDGKSNKTIGEILPPDDDEQPLFSGEAPEGGWEWSADGRTSSVLIPLELYEQIRKQQAKMDAESKTLDRAMAREAGFVPAKKPTPKPKPRKPVESEPKKPGWKVRRILAKLPEFFSNEIPDLSADDDDDTAMKAARAKVFIKMGSNPSDRDSIRRALIHVQKDQLRQKEQLRQK